MQRPVVSEELFAHFNDLFNVRGDRRVDWYCLTAPPLLVAFEGSAVDERGPVRLGELPHEDGL